MSIGRRKIFKSMLLLLVYFLLFVSLGDNIIFADTYNCLPGEYCYDTGSTLEISIPYYTCSNGTCSGPSTWLTNCIWNGGSSCTQSVSPVTGYYTYDACVANIDDVCLTWDKICVSGGECIERECTNNGNWCTNDSGCCTSWSYLCTSWGRECGGGTSSIEAETCCRPGSPPCIPNTSCPDSICTDFGYSVSQTDYGAITKKCPDGCGGELDKTCYCYNCLKECPSPLLPIGSNNLILESFRECTNDCNVKPVENQDDCYEVESPQPTEIFRIIDPSDNGITSDPPNGYDFKSLTHTGNNVGVSSSEFSKLKDLNDPIYPVIMSATYEDTTSSDIEGLFVWFRESHYTEELETPVHLSTTVTPKALATDSWGFMLRRNGSDWMPYVPAYGGATSYWQPATYTTTPNYRTFYISGVNGNQMVEVTILSKPAESTTSVTMNFSLRFSDMTSGNLLDDNVAQGVYKVLLMGLDKFSFTPYDNYPIDYSSYWEDNFLLKDYTDLSYYWMSNQLRYKEGVQEYARMWTDTNQTWTIDYTSPVFNSSDGFTKTTDGNNLIISWNVSDDENLYSIVGNICSSSPDFKPLTLSTSTSGVTLRDDDSASAGFQINPTATDNLFIGKLIKVDSDERTWSFRVDPNILTNSHSGSVTIDIGDNTKGTLEIYLTVFDDAGNIVQEDLRENLSDRLLTGGGLAYSSGGTTFAQLEPIDDTMWTDSMTLPSYSNPSEGLQRKYGGFTSEMWARNYPSILLNSSVAKSYGLSVHDNKAISEINDLYASLKQRYELNRKYLGADLSEKNLNSTLSGDLNSQCTGSYCVLFREENLLISNLTCNKKALIFVKGDLAVNSPLYNSTTPDALSNSNGCIFVVGGDVAINSGTNVSTSFEYEKINAFIVSDGVITINHQDQVIVDGVYMNGGLISMGEVNSIVIKRYLRLEERLIYPVLAIDLHPKYGKLAEKFFGNSYVIQSTEVGLKPY